jgi:hypothetical protein
MPRQGDRVPHPAIGLWRETAAKVMAGMRDTSIGLLVGAAPGFATIAGIFVGLVEPSKAVWLGAGSLLTWAIMAHRGEGPDPLYPARLQLARFRRSERPVDILVVKLPRGPLSARGSVRRRSAPAARAVLRVTDGVAVLPSLHGYGLCAVIEPDARARIAIEGRLRSVCGPEVVLGWASFPEHGVTLESLIEAAADRVPRQVPPPPVRRGPQLQPRRRFAPAGLTRAASRPGERVDRH